MVALALMTMAFLAVYAADLQAPKDVGDMVNYWTWMVHKNTARIRHSRHLSSARTDLTVSYGSPLTRYASVDNHKPVFLNCSELRPSIKEEQPANSFVIQVYAADRDPPENGGKIKYFSVSAPHERLKFAIEEDTGIITSRQMFDRDEPTREKEIYLTVRAQDNGRPQLDDVCTIKVTIEDINDNAPVFDRVKYEESVPEDFPVNHEVMRISATDIDDGPNSIVLYKLKAKQSEDAGYFKIDKNTGVIMLVKPIDRTAANGGHFHLEAVAEDQPNDLSSKQYSQIDLHIYVVESNKKGPVFTNLPIPPIVLLENLTDFTLNIASLSAISNTDEKAPLFELVAGRTEQTNKHSTFRLESEGNTAHIRLGKHMDYESITEYTLIIRIQNKFNLAAETTINIQLQDVNDNIPTFTEVVTGLVSENEPPGTPVMQVRAIDTDATTTNNQVTYELADNQANFHIDLYTGNITTRKTFDREERDFYNVKVIATDNSPSALYSTGEHNRGQQVFRIEIADKNDHPPHFTRREYYATGIAEDANTNTLVTEVLALDNDTASPVTYSIVSGNENQSFLVEGKTGRIRVVGGLDYEKKTLYRLKVRAFDSAYEDFCYVTINISNVNDNPPVFLPYNNNITIQEESIIGGCVTQIDAYDPDIQDRNAPQGIAYYIVKQDQQKLMRIDDKGCLSLLKPLDRDPPNGFDLWQVIISASDDSGGSNGVRESTEVVISLIDINDNAPYLDMVQPVVWNENQGPGVICELVAKDNDGPSNGAPFSFTIGREASADIKSKFIIEDTKLRSLKAFDREEIKMYSIPIQIKDSGTPVQTGTSTLTVIIGDMNDNKMKNGYSTIFAYSYNGVSPDTEIGRVYVNDPDDWDLPDKMFAWRGKKHSNFDLNRFSGMITMLNATPADNFVLNFLVTEQGAKIAKHSVFATVNVTVKVIPDEAIDKSGSIRLAGITAEEFIEPNKNGINKQTIFKKFLAKYFNITEDKVDVFTVLHSPHNTNATLLDIRFSAHGSPYYQPEKLNAAISANLADLEHELGAAILMINIDECLVEKAFCENSCTNFLNKSNVPMPIYTNTTTFIGVRAVIDPFCRCPNFSSIIECYNGGTLKDDGLCSCPKGYEGPNCEMISIGFQGDGWAAYTPFQSCQDSKISLEISSNKPDGLIFYIGPTVPPSPSLYVQDYMALELKDGFPILYVDYGTGTALLTESARRLDDAKNHRLHISWTNTSLQLQVDTCVATCTSLKTPKGGNLFLNVNGPLQLGGSFVNFEYLHSTFNWTHRPHQNGFHGCIRNFTLNSKTYNLGSPGLSKKADFGCQIELAVAVSLALSRTFVIVVISCIIIMIIFVRRRKADDLFKDTDDIRENIINYEDEGGGEGDMNAYDLNVLRQMYYDPIQDKQQSHGSRDEVPDISGFLDGKKQTVDNDPETNPFDDVRHYAYEGGDGNTSGSLSSLASGTDEGDLNFDYLSNFGPRFRKLADMYGEDPSDEEEDNYQPNVNESWC